MKKLLLLIIIFSILCCFGCKQKPFQDQEDDIGSTIETRESIFKNGEKLYTILREIKTNSNYSDSNYSIYYKIGFINEFGETVIEPIYISFEYYRNIDGEIEYVLCGDGENIYVYNIYGELHMVVENAAYAHVSDGYDYFFTYNNYIYGYWEETREYTVYNIKTKEKVMFLDKDVKCYYVNCFDNETLYITRQDEPMLIYDLKNLSKQPIVTTAYRVANFNNSDFVIAANREYDAFFSEELQDWVETPIKQGFINKKGEWVIEPKFNMVIDFIGDVAITFDYIKEDDQFKRVCNIIDKQGNILNEEPYELYQYYNINEKLYFETSHTTKSDSDISNVDNSFTTFILYNYKLEELVVSYANFNLKDDNNFYIFKELAYDTKTPPDEKTKNVYKWAKTGGYQGYVDVNGEWVYKENVYQFLDD